MYVRALSLGLHVAFVLQNDTDSVISGLHVSVSYMVCLIIETARVFRYWESLAQQSTVNKLC